MTAPRTLALAAAAALLTVATEARAQQSRPQSNMSFFVTSVGSGKGADLGGLAGADRHCQSLAQAVGVGAKRWRAYLSAAAMGGSPAVNARDRLGRGPWRNAKGEVIANDLTELHGPNKLTKQTALTEKGTVVNGRGDTPNMHDVLTGSQEDGTLYPAPAGENRTCGNWILSGAEGSAIVGHADRIGLRDDAPSKSWNSSHATRGCSQEGLVSTGGAGLFYCFAAN